MDEEGSMDFRDFWEIIRKRKGFIIFITLLITIIAAVISFFVILPTYEANVSIIVGKPQTKDNSAAQYQDVMMYQNLIKTYSEIAKSELVSDTTAAKLNSRLKCEDIKAMITVSSQQGTQILQIKAKSKSAKEAFDVVNAFSESFSEQAKRVFPTGGDIQVMDRPQVPEKAVGPKKKLNIAIAFVLGLMATIGASFLMEYMDNTIKTEQDVEKYLKLPVLGIVPRNKEA